jgi:hypothetical protein
MAKLKARVSTGLTAGLVGGITIWIYEIVDQTFIRKVASPWQIAINTSVLAFGPKMKELGVLAFVLGVAIHFAVALAWGVLFALIWPMLKARKVEATLAGLVYGVFAWVVMHNGLLNTFSPNPPPYTGFSILNGMVSHTAGFAIPLALTVKARLKG